jgi:hypothetical protein
MINLLHIVAFLLLYPQIINCCKPQHDYSICISEENWTLEPNIMRDLNEIKPLFCIMKGYKNIKTMKLPLDVVYKRDEGNQIHVESKSTVFVFYPVKNRKLPGKTFEDQLEQLQSLMHTCQLSEVLPIERDPRLPEKPRKFQFSETNLPYEIIIPKSYLFYDESLMCYIKIPGTDVPISAHIPLSVLLKHKNNYIKIVPDTKDTKTITDTNEIFHLLLTPNTLLRNGKTVEQQLREAQVAYSKLIPQRNKRAKFSNPTIIRTTH